MSGHRAKAARKLIRARQGGLLEISAASLGVSARWLRRQLRKMDYRPAVVEPAKPSNRERAARLLASATGLTAGLAPLRRTRGGA